MRGHTGNYFVIVFSLSTAILISCGDKTGEPGERDPFEKKVEKSSEEKEVTAPLGFSDLTGIWELKYGTDYGYSFSFYKSYKSLIVLYLKTSSLVFKGVYTLEDPNSIRVNIFEMKFASSLRDVRSPGGFTKTKRSYFIFRGYLKNREGKQLLVINPEKIIIDGKSSHGYFEPLIKLKLKKKIK